MKLNHLTLALAALLLSTAAPAADQDGWTSLFNGKDLTGWKSNEENPGCFTVENGELKVSGGRTHIFYTGANGDAKFKNFELKAKVVSAASASSSAAPGCAACNNRQSLSALA